MAPDAPVSSAPLLPSFSLGSASLVAPCLPWRLSLLPTSSSASLFLDASAGPSGVSLLLQRLLLLLVFLTFLASACFFILFSAPGPSLLLLSLVLRSRWIIPLLRVLPILGLWVRSLCWLLLCLTLFMLRSVACLCTLFADFFVASPASPHLPIFLDWLGFLVCALLFLRLTIALSLCWLLVVLPPLPFLRVCLNTLFMGISLLLLLFLSILPSFPVFALAIVFLGCASGVTF